MLTAHLLFPLSISLFFLTSNFSPLGIAGSILALHLGPISPLYGEGIRGVWRTLLAMRADGRVKLVSAICIAWMGRRVGRRWVDRYDISVQ